MLQRFKPGRCCCNLCPCLLGSLHDSYQVVVTVGATAGGSCADCADLGGTLTLDQTHKEAGGYSWHDCYYYYEFDPAVCDFDYAVLRLRYYQAATHGTGVSFYYSTVADFPDRSLGPPSSPIATELIAAAAFPVNFASCDFNNKTLDDTVLNGTDCKFTVNPVVTGL